MDASLRLRFVQHDKTDRVIPNASEESSAMWMLHCADAPFSMTERACGCPAWQVMLTAYSRKQFVSLSFPRIKKTMYENTHLRQH